MKTLFGANINYFFKNRYLLEKKITFVCRCPSITYFELMSIFKDLGNGFD